MASRTVSRVVANILTPISIIVFATGFFPYKPFMPGLAQYEELKFVHVAGRNWDSPPKAQFDKLIFVVVDALRSDFVFGEDSGMSFVQSLIRTGEALPFTAHATSPTITMPRVKAMTTGSIPSFLDVILNFAESDTTSTLATQDTWLAQIRAKHFENGSGKLIMYGDDTWLKLFPGFFERADGTTSFFVSDFTEVDNNVTRHVRGKDGYDRELLKDDWNAMIMHYLGLDHIGHKAGPRSPNMVPKQKEMDGIVKDIYSLIESECHLTNTLFVLCGDHGMNDGGNHGGSSPGETSPALVFMSPRLRKINLHASKQSPIYPKTKGKFDFYKMVEQSDIAPTLAGLLGFPVPRNNLGVFLEEFLHFWEHPSDRVQLLLQNAKQMKRIVQATYASLKFDDQVLDTHQMGFDCYSSDTRLSDGQSLACSWQRAVRSIGQTNETDEVYKFMREAQNTMSGTASNYDVRKLYIGTSLAFLACMLSFVSVFSFQPVTMAGISYALTLILYIILMFASSYVEEEHNFWYWATSGWLLTLLITSMQCDRSNKWSPYPAAVTLLMHRIIRRWNQTGQKYAGANDIVNSGVFHGKNSVTLWILICIVYSEIGLRLARHYTRSTALDNREFSWTKAIETLGVNYKSSALYAISLLIPAFLFKLGFTAKDAPELTSCFDTRFLTWARTLNLVTLARVIFGSLVISALFAAFTERKWAKMRAKVKQEGHGNVAIVLFDLINLFLITQTKAQNIPLYLLFRIQLYCLSTLPLTPTTSTLTTLLLSQTAYFAFGTNNAISSIDLSNSYNGVSSYNVSAVGFLVFVSNWAGPVYWSLAGLLLLGQCGISNSSTPFPGSTDDTHEGRRRQDGAKEEGSIRTWQVWQQHVSRLTLWNSVMLLGVMASCTVLRQHLFIWTVFSPKFLFAVAWGVAWHYGVTLGLGALLWWCGMW